MLTTKQKRKLPRKLKKAIKDYKTNMEKAAKSYEKMMKGGLMEYIGGGNMMRSGMNSYQTGSYQMGGGIYTPVYETPFDYGMNDQYAYGGNMMYARGGQLYKDFSDYSGSHVNTMAPFYGHNPAKESYMNSSIHGVYPIDKRIGYPKNMYGGNVNSFYNKFHDPYALTGGLSMLKGGGGIHIKKENRGKFTEKANRAGRGVQEHARYVMNNKEDFPTSTVKQANFARNAAKWDNKRYGGRTGEYGMYQMGGMMPPEQAPMPQGGESTQHMMALAQGQDPMMAQQQGMGPEQGMPQGQDQQMQQQEMEQQLMALAQAVAQGDPQAMEQLKQLPPEIQEQVIAMVEQMRQKEPQMARTGKKKKGGRTTEKVNKKDKSKAGKIRGYGKSPFTRAYM